MVWVNKQGVKKLIINPEPNIRNENIKCNAPSAKYVPLRLNPGFL
jgi:hypothetical protein